MMETRTFSGLSPRNSSQEYRHNSTSNQDFKELTLIQALTEYPANTTGTVFLFLLTIVSIFGNVLVCRTIFVTRRLHNPGYYFVASLAVADFLVGVFPLPLAPLSQITHKMKGKWIFGAALCDTIVLATIWFCCASIFSLCGVTWDRYVAVTSPLRYTSRMTNSRVTCIIVTVWMMSFIFGIFNSYAIRTVPERVLCEMYRIPLIYSVLDFIFLWLLPITFVVFVNGKIWKAASRQMTRIQAQTPIVSLGQNSYSQDVTDDVSDGPGNKESHPRQITNSSTKFNRKTLRRIPKHSVPFAFSQDQRMKNVRLKKEIKTFRTFLIVIGCFFFSWTPFFFIIIIDYFRAIPTSTVYVCGMLAYINSGCNPLIYGIFNKDFRQALFDSFKKRSQASAQIRKQASSHSPTVTPTPPR